MQPGKNWTPEQMLIFRGIMHPDSFHERVSQHNKREMSKHAHEFPEGATDYDRRAVHPVLAFQPYKVG